MVNPITWVGQVIKKIGDIALLAGMWTLFALSLLSTIPIDILILIASLSPSRQDPEGMSFTTKLLLDRLFYDHDKSTSSYLEALLMLLSSAIFIGLGMGLLLAFGAEALAFALAISHAVSASVVVLGLVTSFVGALIEGLGEMLGKSMDDLTACFEPEEEDLNQEHDDRQRNNPGPNPGHFPNPLTPPRARNQLHPQPQYPRP